MPDLSPWQREALRELYRAGSVHTTYRSRLRYGCDGLVRLGLAERAAGYGFAFAITDDGRAEHERRYPPAATA